MGFDVEEAKEKRAQLKEERFKKETIPVIDTNAGEYSYMVMLSVKKENNPIICRTNADNPEQAFQKAIAIHKLSIDKIDGSAVKNLETKEITEI